MAGAVETQDRIRSIAAGAVAQIEQAKTLEELEALRIKFLGRNGEITRMRSRDASHATWYSGLTTFVVPGAPVSSCVP